MSDGQSCPQCRRSFRRCECGRGQLQEHNMTPEQVLEETRRLRQAETKLTEDKHKFALAMGWECERYSNGVTNYWKTPEHIGREFTCTIEAVINLECDWAKLCVQHGHRNAEC